MKKTVVTLAINIAAIRVRRADLAGAQQTGTRRARPAGTTAVTPGQPKPAMGETSLP
jgi:hypothetical protein